MLSPQCFQPMPLKVYKCFLAKMSFSWVPGTVYYLIRRLGGKYDGKSLTSYAYLNVKSSYQ